VGSRPLTGDVAPSALRTAPGFESVRFQLSRRKLDTGGTVHGVVATHGIHLELKVVL